jgi:REP element-mobilizing transposase RayT
MLQGGYKIRDQSAIHFFTFAVSEWVDVFTRSLYSDILLDSWRHCQQEKGLLLYAWCIMSNHLHFIASSKNADLSGVLRDFKKFTSKEVIKAIENNSSESRRNWMLSIFRNAGETNSRNKDYQFWRQDNHPIELYSSAFTVQRINYIHQNPVRAGIVEKGEDYRYSSAKDYFQGKKCGLIDICLL